MTREQTLLVFNLVGNAICDLIHEDNKKWWVDIISNAPIKRNVPEMLCLIHSEISEGLEGYRKNLMDDKLPERSMLEVELADAVIRICDMAAGLKLDLFGAIADKLEYNLTREDHTLEHRRSEHGKKI